MRITRELFDSYVTCKTKAHLLLEGKKTTRHEYGALMREAHQTFTPRAISALLRRNGLSSASKPKHLTRRVLEHAPGVVLGTSLDNGSCHFSFDALQRVDSASALGDFSYVPVLFVPQTVREQDKRILTFGALALESLLEIAPSVGILLHGPNCTYTTVKLDKYARSVRQTVASLAGFLNNDSPPPLLLNRHCRYCQFERHCRKQAVSEDNLTLLERLNEKDVIRYNQKGIFTLTQLSYTFRPRKRSKRVKTHHPPFNHALQALALREQQVYVLTPTPILDSPARVYVDMEGNPRGTSIYLIGLHVVTDETQQSYSFWADTKYDEQRIFDDFFETLDGLSSPRIYHYGSYESRVFRRMLESAPAESITSVLTHGATNVLTHVHSHVYFPAHSNSLKAVAQFLGYQWSVHDASGVKSIVWRAEWERSRRSVLKERLLRYNMDDVLALKLLTEFLHTAQRVDGDELAAQDVRVKLVDDIVPPREDKRLWGKMKPAVESFEKVISCAYFDHQRSKVYVRTNPTLKRMQKRIHKTPLKYHINARVEHVADSCRHCKSRNVTPCSGRGNTKLSIDLRYSKTGVRRHVVQHHAHRHVCTTCRRTFFPISFKDENHFGHGLVSWAMYQYVANRMSFSQIGLTAQECFGIRLPVSRCHLFKEQLASEYRETVQRIMTRIVSGSLVHADETKIRLKRDNGFVFVFTSMEEVVYIYRSNRETKFLKDLLCSFQGVLISDFYTGYDSISCLQQKCLVHLIRDLNDDLLRHPFDAELSAIAESFGALMQDIVGTVDRFGLRSRYLRKHKKAVRAWFRDLRQHGVGSNTAEKYRSRFIKYEDKLFVFLEHDGIPWNNNNAEHAVKPFAKYRRLVNGEVSERGLQDYLVLLSFQQTCRYKGVPFLEFLLSKETDVDAFCERSYSRAGRRPVRIDKVGALPIINRMLKRLRLQELLDGYLPPEDQRVKVPATKALLVLLRNLLISREPLHGMGEWAAGYAPDLLDLTPEELKAGLLRHFGYYGMNGKM